VRDIASAQSDVPDADRATDRAWIRWIFYSIVPVVAVVALYLSLHWMLAKIGPWHVDFQVYRFGVEAWWHGRDIYGDLPPTVGNLELPFLYPPFSIVALLPFTVLPWSPSVALLFIVDLGCVVITLYVAARQLWPKVGTRGAAAVASLALPLVLLLEPVNATFQFGQINLVLMALVAVDCLAPKAWWPRGVGVGLAAAIKLTPAAFVLYFLIRRQYRAAATAAVTAAVATAIGFAIAPGTSIKYWFGGLAGASKVSGVPFLTNQSIDAAVVRLGLPSAAATALWLALVVVLVVLAVAAMRRTEDKATALLINAAVVLLASPTSWSHYWVWAAPAMLVLLAGIIRNVRGRSPFVLGWIVAFAGTAIICYLAPFNHLPGFDNRELLWTPSQQLIGACYPLLGFVLVLAYALPALRRRPAPTKTVSHAGVGSA
jgi:alpha-1,2-mannosyltransferase